jgi:hypothetical protein
MVATRYMLVALWRMMRHARRVWRRKEGAEGGFEHLGTEGVDEEGRAAEDGTHRQQESPSS